MNTFTVSTAVTPTVVSTFLSHYLNREPLRQRPTAHLSYDEGLHLIRSFLTFASHHTVEDLQAFTAQWVPHPQWVRVEEIKIPGEKLDEAASLLQQQLGPDGIRQVGGRNWWQWRKPGKSLKAEWIEMKSDYNERKSSGDPKSKRVMFYIHGGAYYFGSVDEHRYQLQRHARKLKARVLAPEYRLSPQFPFPCGLHDCIAAYLYLLTVQDPTTIIFAGDSAGGGMVMSLLVTLRDRGIPLPAGAILISPWVDLTHSFPSVASDCPLDYIPPNGFHHKPSKAWPPLNAEEYANLKEQASKQMKLGATKSMKPASQDGTCVNGEKTLEEVPVTPPLSLEIDGKEVTLKEQMQMYTTNDLLSHPLVSPIMQPTLGGLPPLLIMTGGGEYLRDEQIYLAHKCANPKKYTPAESLLHESAREQIARFKPTDVQLQVWDDLCHVAPTLSFTRPAKFMYRSIAQFGAWALARAQHTEIEILDDDDISVISSSEESDGDNREGSATKVKSTETDVHSAVGKAGDPLPPFKNHMIRQQVSRHGTVTALPPPSELIGCNMPPEEIGVIKAGPVKKWLEARRQWDSRFSSTAAKVQKRRLKAMVAGYEGFDGETPPPSALAGRRKVAAEDDKKAKDLKKRKKSVGLALWSLWGSKHDEATVIREHEADREPETRATTTAAGEGEGARSPADLRTQAKDVARRDMLGSRSRSRRKIVRDERQTTDLEEGEGEGDVDEVGENTPASALHAKEQQQADGSADTTDAYAMSPAAAAADPELDLGVMGKRPKVDGIAVPFSLKREADTASMLTLTSMGAAGGNGGGGEPSSRVVSPMPTTPITPLGNGSDGDGDGLFPPPVARGGAADGQRPPLETFVTAQEDLLRTG